MGLDMYLFRATKSQKKRYDELNAESVQLDKKWDKLCNEAFPNQEFDESKFTPEQKSIHETLRNEYKDFYARNNELHNEMNGRFDKMYNIGETAYWRKFNALHSYIINHFSNGMDIQDDIPLVKEDLEDILESLKKVKSILDSSEKVVDENSPNTYTFIIKEGVELPMKPARGFFFGSEQVDDWFERDVNDAIETFTKILNEYNDDQVFWYYASW